MEPILEQLYRSPKLRLYVDELSETLCKEQAARERFRSEMDDSLKSEFINGEIIVHSPAKYAHTHVVGRLLVLLQTFVNSRRLGDVQFEKALIGLTRNDYEPDICFWTTLRSQAFVADQMIFPAPDFVCEVLSPSTESRDRGVKFEDYAAHGVREYWIVDADQKFIEQYTLAGDHFDLLGKFTSGAIRSRVVEGFEMMVAGAFEDQANLDALWKMKP